MQGTNAGHKVIRQERKLILFSPELSILRLETTAPPTLPCSPTGQVGVPEILASRMDIGILGVDIFGLSDAFRVDSNQFACVVFSGLRWRKFCS